MTVHLPPDSASPSARGRRSTCRRRRRATARPPPPATDCSVQQPSAPCRNTIITSSPGHHEPDNGASTVTGYNDSAPEGTGVIGQSNNMPDRVARGRSRRRQPRPVRLRRRQGGLQGQGAEVTSPRTSPCPVPYGPPGLTDPHHSSVPGSLRRGRWCGRHSQVPLTTNVSRPGIPLVVRAFLVLDLDHAGVRRTLQGSRQQTHRLPHGGRRPPGVGVGEGRRSGEVHPIADFTTNYERPVPRCDLGTPVLSPS